MPVTNYHTLNGRIRGETTNGVRTNYLSDALGSVTATASATSQIQNQYRNRPFGARQSKSGNAADPRFQWNGTRGYLGSDRSNSSHYVRARTYDRVAGRWTTVDPAWPIESRYGYVTANPATATDPSGLQGIGELRAIENLRQNPVHRARCEKQCLREVYWALSNPKDPYYLTCIRCCHDKLVFDFLRKSARSRYQLPDCAKVYRCRRHLSGPPGSAGILHSFNWVDRNCNGQWDAGEFMGWGGPPDYQKPPEMKHLPLGKCEMIEDVNRLYMHDIDCMELDCDPNCILLFLDTFFGPGRCWDPTARKAAVQSREIAASGGYCGLDLSRNCWAFKTALEKECGCKEVGPWNPLRPKGKRPW
ncbi:MAG TPA: hypothetical protein DCQ94_07425 [Nitrospira sp.]|nr:hypothetical protein [Nitrospira sp.]